MGLLEYFIYLCLILVGEINGYRTIKANKDVLILAKSMETVDIVCENDVPLVRCGFTHPNGTKMFALMQKYYFPRNKSLHRGDCGVTIISASESESGVWSCYGWLELENRQYVDTIRLVVEKYVVRTEATFRVFEKKDEVTTILALENEPITIKCSKDIAMSYCGFVHPSGKRFSFSGNELNNGRCVRKLNATKADAGIWTCHIGRKSTGMELVQKIDLRVVDKVAAVVTNVTVGNGHMVTLECATTQGAIEKRYSFPPNKSLDRGDCAVTIRRAKREDFGVWTCGAGMSDGKEYTDSIMVTVEGLYTMSTATSLGLVFGVLAIVVALIVIGYVAYFKRHALAARPGEGNPGFNEGHEMADLELPRPQSPPRSVTPARRSPTGSIRLPGLVVQSPSEPSSSPLMP
ncbi:hypothetical protein MSG28_001469 [Choristoneura fumiferana]|uniref:Uncharacterized protein n=1 Tax=Choristoneura fumiferana TaxID=7141 RepID=A0ACC0KUP2_CHOFU|nr:hypothetical protein MSG28_001469 [Choristoneura fumiferana]